MPLPTPADLREMLVTTGRLLLFMKARPDLTRLRGAYIGAAIFYAWLAGMGRYWDHPEAEWWQYAGLGSVAYIFILSAALYLVIWPLRPENWSPSGVLVFVGLTAQPAILYAIPVERFMDLGTAQNHQHVVPGSRRCLAGGLAA